MKKKSLNCVINAHNKPKENAMKSLLLIIGLLLITSVDAKQKVYKWVDADGNTHYTDKKPTNQNVDEVNVSNRQPTVIGQYNQKQDEADDSRSKEQKDIDEYNEKQEKQANIVQDRENCKIAKKNLETLQQAYNVKRKNPATGGMISMDDDERIKMMRKIKKSIKDLCK
jgi:hypothetical protein